MASTISSANLKVKITEEVILDGKDQGGTTELTIGSVNEVSSRIITISSGSFTTLFNVTTSSSGSAGSFLSSSLKYARVTNKDDANMVLLRVSGSTTTDFRLEPGRSFILTDTRISGSDTGSTTTTIDVEGYTASLNVNSISAEPSGSAVDIEYFIANT